MKKLGYVLSPVFVFALALSAFAQGNERPVNTDKSETVKVNVSGEVTVEGIFRDATLMASRGSAASSNFTMEGWLRLRFDIELTEKVSAVLSLRNQRVRAGTATAATLGPAGNDTNVFGTARTGLIVDKATVSFNEFLTAGLKLTTGIDPDVAFDLRGKGSAFFFDPAHSQTMTKNATNTVTGHLAASFRPDQLQPAGFHLAYGKDLLSVGTFLLPAVIEGAGPTATTDEAAYGLWFTYGLEISGNKQSKVGLLFVYDNLPGPDVNVFTIGGGADIHNLMEGLEFYAELYFQFGKLGPGTAGSTISARGWAFQLGAQYNLPKNENDIWFGLNFTYISGDDTGSPGTSTPTANRDGNFLSYENVNDLLIVEDQYFGVDIDTNYWAIKGGVGGSLKVGSAATNNLHLSVGLGYARLAENAPGLVTTVDVSTIGFEIDPTIAYDVNKQVSAYTKFGVLFGSEVLERRAGGGGGLTTDASETTWTWVLGVSAKF